MQKIPIMSSDTIYYKELFERFKEMKVIVIGDVMIDAYIFGQVDRISPEAPVPVVSVNKRSSRLGGAANVALNLKAMGATALLCSVIGQDDRAEEFIRLLKDENMPTDGILRSKERITTTKFRVIGNNVQLLRVDEENTSPLTSSDELKLFTYFQQLIERYHPDAIIFQDYDKGVLTPGLIGAIITKANEMGLPITVDPKKRNFKQYKNVDLFKPNLKELREGMEMTIHRGDFDALEIAASRIQDEMSLNMVMVTLSENGVYLRKRKSDLTYDTFRLPAHRRNIADVSGAGDTVISLATLCLAARCDVTTIARISNLAGGLVCEEVGVVPVDADKLLQETIKLYTGVSE